MLEDVGWHQRRARWLTVAAFIALGAGIVPMIRLVVGLSSSPTAEDPWGPLDAFVILAGVLLWAATIVCFSASRRHTRVAAALAVRQLVEEHGARVRLARVAEEAASPARLGRVVEQRGWRVIPVDELEERDRLAQLFIAARSRPGTRRERVDRFGRHVASRYARVVFVRSLTLGALIAVSAVAGTAGVAAIIAGGSARHATVTTAVVIIFTVIAVSPIVGVLLRRSPAGLLHRGGRAIAHFLARERVSLGGESEVSGDPRFAAPRAHFLSLRLCRDRPQQRPIAGNRGARHPCNRGHALGPADTHGLPDQSLSWPYHLRRLKATRPLGTLHRRGSVNGRSAV